MLGGEVTVHRRIFSYCSSRECESFTSIVNGLKMLFLPFFQRPQQPPNQQERYNLTHESKGKDLNEKIEEQAKEIRNIQASMQRLEAAIGQLAQSISKRPQGTLPSNMEENPRGQVKAIHLEEAKLMSVKMEEPKEEEEIDGNEEEESNLTDATQEESVEGKSEIVEEEEQGSDILEASNSSNSWQRESEGDTCGQEEEDETEKSELWSEDDGSISSRDDGDSNEEGDGSEILQSEEDHDAQSKEQIGYTNKAAPKGDEKEGNSILNKEEEEDEEDGPHTSRWTMETLPSKLGDLGSFSIPC